MAQQHINKPQLAFQRNIPALIKRYFKKKHLNIDYDGILYLDAVLLKLLKVFIKKHGTVKYDVITNHVLFFLLNNTQSRDFLRLLRGNTKVFENQAGNTTTTSLTLDHVLDDDDDNDNDDDDAEELEESNNKGTSKKIKNKNSRSRRNNIATTTSNDDKKRKKERKRQQQQQQQHQHQQPQQSTSNMTFNTNDTMMEFE